MENGIETGDCIRVHGGYGMYALNTYLYHLEVYLKYPIPESSKEPVAQIGKYLGPYGKVLLSTWSA